MKRLLALISIRKLKRMKAKPLKRHCIFPKRHKNLSDKAAKEPDGFLKKIALMAFNFSFIFPLKSGSLRAQKYSLNEMKNEIDYQSYGSQQSGLEKQARYQKNKPKGRIRCLMAIFQSNAIVTSFLVQFLRKHGSVLRRKKNCFGESLCLAFFSMSTTRCEHQPSRPSFHHKMSQYR